MFIFILMQFSIIPTCFCLTLFFLVCFLLSFWLLPSLSLNLSLNLSLSFSLQSLRANKIIMDSPQHLPGMPQPGQLNCLSPSLPSLPPSPFLHSLSLLPSSLLRCTLTMLRMRLVLPNANNCFSRMHLHS